MTMQEQRDALRGRFVWVADVHGYQQGVDPALVEMILQREKGWRRLSDEEVEALMLVMLPDPPADLGALVVDPDTLTPAEQEAAGSLEQEAASEEPERKHGRKRRDSAETANPAE